MRTEMGNAFNLGCVSSFFFVFIFLGFFFTFYRGPGRKEGRNKEGNQDPGSRIQDPGTRIQDPGSGIWDPGSLDPGSRIPDPLFFFRKTLF